MLKWIKTTTGFKSKCGRFAINRFIRRGCIEWGLVDHVCPVEPGVSGACRRLVDAKDAAEWRLVNRPGNPLIDVLD